MVCLTSPQSGRRIVIARPEWEILGCQHDLGARIDMPKPCATHEGVRVASSIRGFASRHRLHEDSTGQEPQRQPGPV